MPLESSATDVGELEKLTGAILGAAFEVSNMLGHGFLEGVYEKALIDELGERNLTAPAQAPFEIRYKEVGVGVYYADILVEEKVILELKAIEFLTDAHVAQVVNYLKASGVSVELLLNFGEPKLQYRRVLSPLT